MKWVVYCDRYERTDDGAWRVVQDFDLRIDLAEDGELIAAGSAQEAITLMLDHLTEQLNLNALGVCTEGESLCVYVSYDDMEDDRPAWYYTAFRAVRQYLLLGADGESYYSDQPGQLGGHRQLKIYGRLDCPSALRYLARGQYSRHRVFFADEETARRAGYRPCAVCMPQAYAKWKQQRSQQDES